MNALDPIVPFQFFPERHDAMLQAMREMRHRWGIRRFLLTGPGLGVRLSGYPQPEVYQQQGQLIASVKEALASDEIEVGWWCTPTLKSGKSPYQNIVGLNGRASAISSCPLDLAFRAALSTGVATVATIAHPFMLQLEDDFELSNHPGIGGFGCFCPLHLAEFAKRAGRFYTREALVDLFGTRTAESLHLRRLWHKLSCDSLVGLATEIERAVHDVSPQTRLALCQAGCADLDGNFTQPVARALAGSLRPAVRVSGTSYASDTARDLPGEMFNLMASCEHLPEDFELFHEADTYPHTCFFMSAIKLQSMMAIAFSCGCDDALLYATQYLDDPLEEKAYLEMVAERAPQFNAWRQAIHSCQLIGCEILYHADAATAVPWEGRMPMASASWPNILGRYGVPYTTRKGNSVKLLSGETAAILTQTQLETLLSGGVLLDGSAAQILDDRGYGDLLGVSVKPGRHPAFCHERLRKEATDSEMEGELIYNYLFAPAGAESGGFHDLQPHPDAEILSDFLDPHGEVVQAGMLRFENRRGGRVGVMAFDLRHTKSSSIFCYRKREAIVHLLEWLNREKLPVKVKRDPNLYLLANASSSGELFLTVINLGSDKRSRLSLEFATRWRNAPVQTLSISGEWNPLAILWRGEQAELELDLPLMQPCYLRLSPPSATSVQNGNQPRTRTIETTAP